MESRASAGPGVAVLIVEDDRRIRQAMRLLLATLENSACVVAVPSAEAALHRAVELSPGVAVIGLSVSDAIASLHLLRALKNAGWQVVALSAQSGLLSTALAHGAAAFVDTGADPDEIIRLVHQLLGHAHPDRRSDAIDAVD